MLEENGDDGSAEGQAETEGNVIFIGFLEGKCFVHDCSGREEIERDCEEERNHHEALPDGHAGGRNGGHHQSVYTPHFSERLQQEIAAHAYQGVSDDFGDVDSVEDFGQPALAGIFEVED